MSDFLGRLTIIGNQSSLDNDLLLQAGIADANQAIAAATQFLRVSKHFSPGQMITVTGNRGQLGNASIIIMTDARAAAQPFVAAEAQTVATTRSASGRKSAKARAKKSGKKKGAKKTASKKSAPSSRKARSKSKASRKATATKKRGAAKTSKKKKRT